jgi:hypothetical protein
MESGLVAPGHGDLMGVECWSEKPEVDGSTPSLTTTRGRLTRRDAPFRHSSRTLPGVLKGRPAHLMFNRMSTEDGHSSEVERQILRPALIARIGLDPLMGGSLRRHSHLWAGVDANFTHITADKPQKRSGLCSLEARTPDRSTRWVMRALGGLTVLRVGRESGRALPEWSGLRAVWPAVEAVEI